MLTWAIRGNNQNNLILLIFCYFVGSLLMTQVLTQDVAKKEENNVIKTSKSNNGKGFYDLSKYCLHPKNSTRPPREAGLPQFAWSCALPLWQDSNNTGPKVMRIRVNDTNNQNETLNGGNNTLKLNYLSIQPTGFRGTRHRLSGSSPPKYNSYFGTTPIKSFYRL